MLHEDLILKEIDHLEKTIKQEKKKTTADKATQSVGNLRLILKYLIFDTEALKRENKALKIELEGSKDDSNGR